MQTKTVIEASPVYINIGWVKFKFNQTSPGWVKLKFNQFPLGCGWVASNIQHIV